eukprot:CAMPEP_0170509130 /NCGR_PEP_ID=MMETSP0208-20121228/64474_1 /TAXON_ID=197538 /ORGANISM="Strombidium inclinatum, Strain S3" /LENGTH=98 /DNA_ID=CAMNT_0010792387 /DNA_START=368 /DNA_END=664 /DNA_ORIENTATION=-
MNLFDELKKANSSDFPINMGKRLDEIENQIQVLRSYKGFSVPPGVAAAGNFSSPYKDPFSFIDNQPRGALAGGVDGDDYKGRELTKNLIRSLNHVNSI